MVIVRCTARLLDLLRVPARSLVDVPASDGDWYANLVWIDRRKCLLLTHAGTLFPVFVADVRAAELKQLGAFVAAAVQAALAEEGLAADACGPLDPGAAGVAKTANRSVVGFMNDSTHMCQAAVEQAGGLAHVDVAALNRILRRNLHNRDGYVQPLELVRQWPAGA